jgi:hypothetical protein
MPDILQASEDSSYEAVSTEARFRVALLRYGCFAAPKNLLADKYQQMLCNSIEAT